MRTFEQSIWFLQIQKPKLISLSKDARFCVEFSVLSVAANWRAASCAVCDANACGRWAHILALDSQKMFG